MAQTYKEAMDHIAVTPQMRSRVLQQIQQADLTPSRARSLPMRRGLAAAACLVVLLVGAVTLPRLLQPTTPGVESSISSIVQVASQEELSQLVGFEVPSLGFLPFSAEEVRYASYPGQMAETAYYGQEQSLVLRAMAGTDDPSGDYTSYTDISTLEIQGRSVTLKGEDGLYTLALWQDESCSYSLRSTPARSAEDWTQILEAVE